LAEVSMKYLARFCHHDLQRFSAQGPHHCGDGQRLDEFSQTAAFILLAQSGISR
jgi:hypothetical protein